MTKQLVQAGSHFGVSYSIEDKADKLHTTVTIQGKHHKQIHHTWREAANWVDQVAKESLGYETNRTHTI